MPRKRKILSFYEEQEAPVEFASKVEEYYQKFIHQAIGMVVNCVCYRFQQKDYIETLEIMEMLLLKALHEEDFSHEIQQYLPFLAVTWINLNWNPTENFDTYC